MSPNKQIASLMLAAACALFAAACMTPAPHPVSPPPAPEPVAPPPETPEQIAARKTEEAARTELKEGVDLYNTGDYNGAIKHLMGGAEIWISDPAIELDALKYMAFSYCVTNRITLCRQQFEKAFKIDPNFTLKPGEMGHPLWGPQFERARRETQPK